MKYYSVKEVAAILGLSYSFVRFLILNKRLEAIDVGCGKERIWRVSNTELERFRKDNSSLNIGEEK
jgi:excisionase family DNA binding protein